MKTNTLILVLIAVGLSFIFISFSGEGDSKFPTGAPLGYTGSPGDGQNCTSCHNGTATNTSGIISTNIPATGYVAGTTYNITVSFSGSGKKGFELSPQKPSGEQVGSLIAGTGSQILANGKYITHTQANNNTTATWNFQWQAPAQPGSGAVTFYLAHVIKKQNTYLSNLTVEEDYQLGLAEHSPVAELTVYPNPAHDHLFVKSDLPVDENTTFTLVSASGRKATSVYAAQAGKNNTEWFIPLPESLTRGFYLLKMQTGNVVRVSKLIVN